MRFALAVPAMVASVIALTVLAGVAPAHAQSCLDRDCFRDSDVREFRVIDTHRVIVYVGQDRCPYLIETHGVYCNLQYIPEIDFFNERDRRILVSTGRRDPYQRGFLNPGESRFSRNDRVCANQASQLALETFGFGQVSEDEVPADAAQCPVRSVVRITDDDIVQLHAEQGVTPPLPPVGNGVISRKDDAARTAQ